MRSMRTNDTGELIDRFDVLKLRIVANLFLELLGIVF